jgi:hypothetical protein
MIELAKLAIACQVHCELASNASTARGNGAAP